MFSKELFVMLLLIFATYGGILITVSSRSFELTAKKRTIFLFALAAILVSMILSIVLGILVGSMITHFFM